MSDYYKAFQKSVAFLRQAEHLDDIDQEMLAAADRIAVLEAEAMDMSNAYTALLDAVKKAATPDGCPMDEWADGWNACCRSILAALGGDHES